MSGTPRGVRDPWGIAEGYHDIEGRWHPTTPTMRRKALEAMGLDPSRPVPPSGGGVLVQEAGQAGVVEGPAELVLEDGTVLRVEGSLPPDLPIGYHGLRPLRGGISRRLIVTPGRCYLPEGTRAWGWAVQVYALWSATSWGIGDLVDLGTLARWAGGEQGAGFLLLSPLGASAPVPPQQASPYFPSSRRFLSPLYLQVESVGGASESGVDLESLVSAGRALRGRLPIDRDAVLGLKREALERIWAHRRGNSPEFERYRAREGEALAQFATYCTVAERHGSNWRVWPEEWRHPRSGAAARLAGESDRVRFHMWIQWLLAEQLSAAASEIRLIHDLPIGVDPDGADAWIWQDLLARGASVGAPPDAFNPAGQDWGVPPFVPHLLRASGYAPLVQTLRALLGRGGGIRIDHVMGLFRLFWVPWGGGPADGTYVRYHAEELLAVLAVESHRARAVVVGEDLGTVEEGVREELALRRVLSCRLLWFEDEPPSAYPTVSLAAITTHDLPTVAGVWTGADLEDQRAAGVAAPEDALQSLRARLERATGLPAGAPPTEVVRRVHEALATAPSVLLTATLEDGLAVTHRPNLPGTTDQRPNWSRPLPLPVEAITRHPLPRAVGQALARSHDGGSTRSRPEPVNP